MTVFVNNTEVNLMAQKGMVNLDAYKTVQQQFNDLNQKFVKQAFDGSGFDPHASELKLNPGTGHGYQRQAEQWCEYEDQAGGHHEG
jgi:hypothetical protein